MADVSEEDKKLREDLLAFGETVGKINDKTRPILVKKLNHFRARQNVAHKSGRTKGTVRRTTTRAVVARNSSSEDGDEVVDDGIILKENGGVNVRAKNLRRRTIDVGLFVNRSDREPMQSTPKRSSRRSFGSTAATDSPFMAGSLRKPVASSPARHSSEGKPAGDLFNTSVRKIALPTADEEDLNFSDDDYTFREMASIGVNTSQSLEKSRNGKLDLGDLKKGACESSSLEVSPRPQWFQPVYGLSAGHHFMSVHWHTISQLLLGSLAAFVVTVVLLYVFAISSSVQTTDFSTNRLCPTETQCSDEDIINSRNTAQSIADILSQRAGDFECGQHAELRGMTLESLKKILSQQYHVQNDDVSSALTVISRCPDCGIQLLDSQNENTSEINRIVYLESVHADKSLWCRLTAAVHRVFNYIVFTVGGTSLGLVIVLLATRWRKAIAEESKEVNCLVEEIIVLLKNHAAACRSDPHMLPYVAIPHVRDALIPVTDRAAKQNIWDTAAKMLSMNESRVREEVKTIDGEECCVWRWIDTSPAYPEGVAVTVARGQQSVSASPAIRVNSTCLRICNMIDPSQGYSESEVSDAVLERCGAHSGILHIGITTAIPVGVYVKFVSESAARQACRQLHGWTYNGRMTSVKEVGAAMYRALFPESSSAMVPLRSSSRRLSKSFSLARGSHTSA